MHDMLNATLEIAYFDTREARNDVPAQVALEAGGMTLLTPAATGDPVLWHGERRGQGHYVLNAPDAGMEASLHRFADSSILEGFWRRGAERGFWRLHLPEDAVIPRELRAVSPPAEAKPRQKAPRKRLRQVA